MSDELIWLLITTAIALVAGGISGWVSAMYRRREQRQERLRLEVLRWANPILGSVRSLRSRLENILDQDLYVALDRKAEWSLSEDWAIDRVYAVESTLFVFAEYFAWVQLLHEKMSFELFESEETKDEFFDAVWKVSGALSKWPDARVEERVGTRRSSCSSSAPSASSSSCGTASFRVFSDMPTSSSEGASHP
jgi:hypothetical protein